MSQDRLATLASSKNAGFSLTELLVVIVMFGIIATAAYSLFREQGRISRAQQSILDMQSNGRAALNLLAQSFSHAGFGSSDTNDKFLDVKDDDPDNATITYGHKHVANVESSIGTTPTNEINYSLEPDQTIELGDKLCIYPSLAPNITYTVNKIGPPLEIAPGDPNIVIVPVNAKIYRVFPVNFSVADEKLYMEDSDGTTEIVFNVAAFEVAYLEEGASGWSQGTKLVSNPQAMYIYFVLRTNEKEPGFKQGNPFVLPWDPTQKPSFPKGIQDGYHYQSFETIVWIRNAK